MTVETTTVDGGSWKTAGGGTVHYWQRITQVYTQGHWVDAVADWQWAAVDPLGRRVDGGGGHTRKRACIREASRRYPRCPT